jgi:TPR repeat protein
MITKKNGNLKDNKLSAIYDKIKAQSQNFHFDKGLDWELHFLGSKQAEAFIEFNRETAENNDPLACICMAYILFFGKHQFVDKAASIYWLRKAADQKFGDADNILGSFCRRIHAAAERGDDPKDQYAYATILYHGVKSVPYTSEANPFTANYYFEMAANQGDIRARMHLAEWHLINNLQTKAFHHYKIAADAGNADAQNFVGTQYRDGRLVSYNQELAFKYFKRASDQRHADADCNLACFYFSGTVKRVNYKKALKLFKRAFDNGCVRALLFIGLMHYNGQGVQKDIVTAHALMLEAFYLTDAQDPNYRATEDALTMVEKEMTPEERQKSVKLRADCHAFAK